MKKIELSNILSFILGMLIFGSITGVYAEYKINAVGIDYKNTTVKAAIDSLNSKVKPNYSGSYTVTPQYTEQTLSTKNKILNDDITIAAIPNTYKNLTTPTTVKDIDVLSGKKIYNNLGNLITGSISNNCISGSKPNGNNQQLSTFNPSFFVVYSNDTNKRWYNIYDINNDSSNYYDFNTSGTNKVVRAITNAYTINNGLYTTNWNYNSTIYYVVCE